MNVRTFGAERPAKTQSTTTYLQAWDADGVQHQLRLYTQDNLTKNFSEAKLDEEDLQFIRRNHIQTSTQHTGIISPPQILIGCDQLWSFINFEAPQFTLPSGLILIPTRLSYMVSRQRFLRNSQYKKLLNSSVHTRESSEDFDQWELHWRKESHEMENEYTGPEKEEKANINAKVLEEFNRSIEKRENIAYFVRLPLKKEHEPLPDNRALAYHRLRSILRKYENETKLLQQYHEVFQDQLKKNIREEVDESHDSFTKMRHYLPHQPVITPEKDNTKFRVVFDASAHYKNSPSLNDVVHQGPTVLPKLYGILLRFRTGQYVLLSDVEKAFLQRLPCQQP
ncbi:hypothetical protein NECAME_13596 [Necator americanus]|uniref:Uncharacterized protein n=1 Tax=Necator americanus TaxID=51031 RepID=W2SUH0_NECAM|nr:hypothetical protein NECAME_13596 [Necator americanus]ETN73173.1 hypothetical protein NECAME_13596 [Necator americanus]